MIITRPYNAEDNEINHQMRIILERYLSKIGSDIQELQIYGLSVIAITGSGDKYQMSKAEGCKLGNSYNQSNYFYMTKTVNGKRIRIKKTEW